MAHESEIAVDPSGLASEDSTEDVASRAVKGAVLTGDPGREGPLGLDEL